MEYANSLALILVEPSQESKGKGGRTCSEELAQDVDREDHDDAVEANSVAGPSARAGAGNLSQNDDFNIILQSSLKIISTQLTAAFQMMFNIHNK